MGVVRELLSLRDGLPMLTHMGVAALNRLIADGCIAKVYVATAGDTTVPEIKGICLLRQDGWRSEPILRTPGPSWSIILLTAEGNEHEQTRVKIQMLRALLRELPSHCLRILAQISASDRTGICALQAVGFQKKGRVPLSLAEEKWEELLRTAGCTLGYNITLELRLRSDSGTGEDRNAGVSDCDNRFQETEHRVL